MEQELIKPIVRVGNGAGIILPKAWINGKVRVRLIEKPLNIKQELIELIGDNLDKVLGVYLYGSYAREEQKSESDVDALIISSEKFKINKKSKIDLIVIEKEKIKRALEINPILFYSIIKEAKPIINSSLLSELKKEKINPDYFLNFIKDTKKMNKINKEFIKIDNLEKEKYSQNSTIYSLILRLRGIFIIETLLKNKKYSNKSFREWIIKKTKITPKNYYEIYKVYSIVRNNKKTKNLVSLDISKKLIELLENQIKETENLIKNAKKKKTT